MDKKTGILSEFLGAFQDKNQFFEYLSAPGQFNRRIGGESLLIVIFSSLYGLVMGSYNGFLQALSSAVKLPILFTLSLLICFPAFFMLQQVLGSKLGLRQMLSIMLAGFAMISLIMASFAPIVVFFLITGDNYGFLKLLHVGIFGLSSLFGMRMVIDALRYSCEEKKVYPKIGVQVFRFWIIILAFVGMQLGWNLRPFIGDRGLPFELFRAREGNFYTAIAGAAIDMVDGPAIKQSSKKTSDQKPSRSQNEDANNGQ